MSKVKHNPDAPKLIDDSIKKMESFVQTICKKLRAIILKAEPNIIEDWKWGPNYYSNGMVCGYWGFKQHVTFTFFQGAMLKDEKKVLHSNPGNLHNRHIKYTDVKQIDNKTLIAYIQEAVANNKKGLIVTEAKDKTILIPLYFKKSLEKNKILKNFEVLSYSKRKDYVQWIEGAKQEETREKRMNIALKKIKRNEGMNDKYMVK